ncbi:putative ankyrin repeat-containing domain superfamily [Helianthus annuus]|nr:putative ankyrin repeat-containing domain superfamily [Helianthus annuus]
MTVFFTAIQFGDLETVKTFLDGDPNLIFDKLLFRIGRACRHYAAFKGHSHCLQKVLSSARTSPVAVLWEFGLE